ncbi:hypothetical protein [Streptomyces subrutilus]|nr:hypothetical protein [Streptomyces subrutilus]
MFRPRASTLGWKVEASADPATALTVSGLALLINRVVRRDDRL